MAENRDLQPYDPEEANRQLRSQLDDTVREARKGGKWLVRSQMTVAAATVIMTIFNGWTVSLTYKQIEAVHASIQQAQQQFNLSQRPWVAASDFRITEVEIGKKPHAVVKVFNKGLTPAIVRTRLWITIASKLLLDLRPYDPAETSTAILLPDSGGSVSVDSNKEVSEQTMAKLNSGELVLYAHGFSEYEDTKGNPYPRTLFCIYWDQKKRAKRSALLITLFNNNIERVRLIRPR